MIETAAANDPTLTPEAKSIASKFEEILSLFADCHNLYEKPALSQEEIITLGIIMYMRLKIVY